MTGFRRDRLLLAVLAAMTAGVLVYRTYPAAGFWISLAGLAALFLSGVRRAVAGAVRYRSLAPLSCAWVALQGIQLIIIINSIITHRVHYFTVLLILGAEYFIWDTQSRR
ncbi:MAG: hypothetical protein LIO85_09180 [Rikenellaceae bacterium]|nr:hypothetical protein [Rikenellaceae bacterium]